MELIAKLVCLVKGHTTFSYVFHSYYPKEHAYWCGRCGYESSEEADQRGRKERIEIAMLQHYYSHGRYM